MKNIFQIPFSAVVLAVALGLLAAGCTAAHPHSAYLPIHQFAINGDAAGVTAELAKDPAELNQPEDDGLTPLHLAAQNCHTNVVELLLAKGAKINVTARDDATPLHLAAQEGCADVVTVLLHHAASINARDDKKRTPLTRAEQWHQDEIVQLLKQHGGTE